VLYLAFGIVWNHCLRFSQARNGGLRVLIYSVAGGLVRNVGVVGWESRRWTWCGKPGSESSISSASLVMSAGKKTAFPPLILIMKNVVIFLNFTQECFFYSSGDNFRN